MAELIALNVDPDSIPYGGTASVEVEIKLDPGEPGKEAIVTVTIDGQAGTGEILIGHREPEQMLFSTDPNDSGTPGICVLTADVGTLTYIGAGKFIYTAPFN